MASLRATTWLALIVTVAAAAACAGSEGGGGDGTPTPSPNPTPSASPSPSPSPSPTPPVYDLSFEGTGFDGPYGGLNYSAAVVECDSGAEPCTGTIGTNGSMSGTVPASGPFEMTFEDVLREGPTYELHLWVDFDESGECEPPATDHQWAHVIGTVTTHATLAVEQDTLFTTVCGTFE